MEKQHRQGRFIRTVPLIMSNLGGSQQVTQIVHSGRWVQVRAADGRSAVQSMNEFKPVTWLL